MVQIAILWSVPFFTAALHMRLERMAARIGMPCLPVMQCGHGQQQFFVVCSKATAYVGSSWSPIAFCYVWLHFAVFDRTIFERSMVMVHAGFGARALCIVWMIPFNRQQIYLTHDGSDCWRVRVNGILKAGCIGDSPFPWCVPDP